MNSSSETYQPAGNYYDKYHTRNPIARALMNGFLGAFDELTALTQREGVGSGLEIGCGEAELSIRLAARGWQMRGYDIAEEAVEEARRRVHTAGLNIPLEVRRIEDCGDIGAIHDLVVCCEVMEHLEDPLGALEMLASLSRKYVLVSVPREPVWRILNLARGRYLSDLGNTPGHVQHWSRSAYLRLLRTRLDVVAVRNPLPWTMALCRVKPESGKSNC